MPNERTFRTWPENSREHCFNQRMVLQAINKHLTMACSGAASSSLGAPLPHANASAHDDVVIIRHTENRRNTETATEMETEHEQPWL